MTFLTKTLMEETQSVVMEKDELEHRRKKYYKHLWEKSENQDSNSGKKTDEFSMKHLIKS